MSLFGEKCARCGKRTRSKEDGVAICTQCKAEMLADKEAKRKCPDDGTWMEKEIVRGIVLDKCPRCGGVWLDSGELNLIKKAIQDAAAGNFASGLMMGIVIGQ
jgi:hypothetical protein